MDNPCIYHEKLEQRLSHVESDVFELKTQTALDSQKFSMLLESLSELPNAIVAMKDSLTLMQGEIRRAGDKTESLESKLDKLDAKVVAIDKNDKISILEFLKTNFVVIAIAVTGMGFWVTTLFKK